MGKHQETGEFDRLVRSGLIRRASYAALIAAAAVVTYGFQAPTLPAPTTDPTAAHGSVQPRTLEPTASGSSGMATALAQTVAYAPVQVDPAALLSFDRATVRTMAADGSHRLTVASHGLVRPSAGTLRAPLEVLHPSSPFGLRINPISGEAGEFHWGQDFAAACGTRVYSADAGVVRAVGWHPWGGGNRVEIDHGKGLITTYNHLEAIAVKQGASVEVGEVIARVGTTGSSTGCHLHFETIVNGVHANPGNWTLLPISQVDPLGNIPMVSYEPGRGTQAAEAPVWAVPAEYGHEHSVTGGEHEGPVATTPDPGTTAPPTSASPSPSGSPSVSPSPTPSGTVTSPGTATTPPATTTPPVPSTPSEPAPTTEAPVTSTPTTEPAPTTEAPVTSTPTTEPATTEAPDSQVVTAEAPATDEPAAPAPTATILPGALPAEETTPTMAPASTAVTTSGG